jgi:serine protease SohB
VQKALESKGVEPFLFTAGEHKRTVDFIGEVTEEGKKKEQEQLAAIHTQFKAFVKRGRPQIKDIDKVATGEWWMGEDALRMGLVDEIGTSDDYLMTKAKKRDVRFACACRPCEPLYFIVLMIY